MPDTFHLDDLVFGIFAVLIQLVGFHLKFFHNISRNWGAATVLFGRVVLNFDFNIAVVFDVTFADMLAPLFKLPKMDNLFGEIMTVPMSRIGPLLPYALMIVMLLVRPRGLLGTRDT